MTTKQQTLELRSRTIDGVRIRYADSGGSQEPTLLLTSPWPESVYAFAPMWATLAEHARAVRRLTCPGSGHPSAARIFCLPARWAGSWPGSSSRRISVRPHIVAPDVGTSAALFAAAAHPERIASVIVGTGGAAVPIDLASR